MAPQARCPCLIRNMENTYENIENRATGQNRDLNAEKATMNYFILSQRGHFRKDTVMSNRRGKCFLDEVTASFSFPYLTSDRLSVVSRYH